MHRLTDPMEIIAALDEAVTMSATIRIIKLALSDAAAVAVEPLQSTLATLATEIEDLARPHSYEWGEKCPAGDDCTCGATAHNEHVDRLVKLARGER